MGRGLVPSLISRCSNQAGQRRYRPSKPRAGPNMTKGDGCHAGSSLTRFAARCFDDFASNGRQDLVFALPISFCSIIRTGKPLSGGGGDEHNSRSRSLCSALHLDHQFHQGGSGAQTRFATRRMMTCADALLARRWRCEPYDDCETCAELALRKRRANVGGLSWLAHLHLKLELTM